eukprot:SAG25_NODE_193_length_12184_cov_5.527844_14_plen_57_part_00
MLIATPAAATSEAQPCRGWMTVSDAFLALCVLVERLITPLFYYLVIVSQDSIAAQV